MIETLSLVGYMILIYALPVVMLIKWNGEDSDEHKR